MKLDCIYLEQVNCCPGFPGTWPLSDNGHCMKNKSLWYLDRNGTVKGPFPSRVIGEYLLLGRIHDTDLVSRDKEDWQPLSEHADLYPPVMQDTPVDNARLLDEQLKVDERTGQRRSQGRPGMAEERRRARDRRMDENPEFPLYRRQRAHVLSSIYERESVPGKSRAMIYLVSLSILLIMGGLILNPGEKDNGAQCYQPPRPGIDWSYCKLQGIDLGNQDMTGAVLHDARLDQATLLGTNLKQAKLDYAVVFKANASFADFSDASLKGIDFREADLSYANFTNADLSYADLSGAVIGGANFTNTRLDNAIWFDGETCLRGSVGECLVR